MPSLPGLDADVYFGEPGRPLPDWRKGGESAEGPDGADPDPDEPTPEEREAVVAMLGFDPGEGEGEAEGSRPDRGPGAKGPRANHGRSNCGGACGCPSCRPRTVGDHLRARMGPKAAVEPPPERVAYARSTPLVKNASGQHVSAQSKTGDPKCSAAVSAWKTGKATAETHKQLGLCRSMAMHLRNAHLQRAAGHEARAQHIEHLLKSGKPTTARGRKTRLQELKGRRKAKGATDSAEARPAPATLPKPKAEGGFSLKQDSATGTKATTFEDAGPGRTGTMFDMKRGDLPGQTSIFDRVGTVQASSKGPEATPAPGSTFREYQPTSSGKPKAGRADLRTMPKGQGPGQPSGDIAGLMAGMNARRQKTAERLRGQRAEVRKAHVDPASHTEHAPGTITPLRTDLINFDPERFQYKLGHSATTGSVGSLSGVGKWNPELGGIMQVWKDPKDGKTYVINGHNRLDLAKRLGAGQVNVQFIHAPTAEAAKAKGALTNIAEGRGSSIDSANFFRSSGVGKEDLERHGIPMKEKVATEGLALSRLPEPVFRRVVEGTIHPEKAAMVGGSGLSHAQQQAVVSQMDKAGKTRPMTGGHLKELLDNARAAGSAKTVGFDLFGPNEEETSLALHRSKLQEHIRDRLSREKRLFGTVARSRSAEDLARAGNVINAGESAKVSQEAGNALDVFDLLKNASGNQIPHLLNRGAERIHAGEHPRKVAEEAYAEILREARGLLGGGQARVA